MIIVSFAKGVNWETISKSKCKYVNIKSILFAIVSYVGIDLQFFSYRDLVKLMCPSIKFQINQFLNLFIRFI